MSDRDYTRDDYNAASTLGAIQCASDAGDAAAVLELTGRLSRTGLPLCAGGDPETSPCGHSCPCGTDPS